jgi:DNA-binding transcriptional ArsR family regulator
MRDGQIQQTLKSKIVYDSAVEPMREFHRCCPSDPSVRVRLNEKLTKELSDLPGSSELDQLSTVLRALSHPLRLKIALLLLKRDHCVCELVQLTGKKPNLVSHHLAAMREQGIVEYRRESGWKYYSLTEGVAGLMRGCGQAITAQTP